jgi:hypothetical protein
MEEFGAEVFKSIAGTDAKKGVDVGYACHT